MATERTMESSKKWPAFCYFCSILDHIYEEVFKENIDSDVKNTELYEQKVLYFSCLFSKDQQLFRPPFFNKWESWEKGPVEKDIHNLLRK